jgi:hypothetical protein
MDVVLEIPDKPPELIFYAPTAPFPGMPDVVWLFFLSNAQQSISTGPSKSSTTIL